VKAQEAQGEALEIDRIDIELSVAELDKDLASIRTKLERQLGVLRQYWGVSDLTEEELAAPEITAASGIHTASLEEVLEQAEMHRPDLRAAGLALATHRGGRRFAAGRPELELKVAGRLGEMDRDWTDEGREDSTYEAEAELHLTYPLSQRRRNAVKLKGHTLLENTMNLQMMALREEIRRKVSEAYEIYRQFCADLKIKAMEIEKAEEQERLIRLKSQSMPEMLGNDPLSKVRTARVDVLAAKVNYLKIERDRMQARMDLLAEIGKLVPSPIPLLRFGQ
jgi:outer membrane protein TolC